MPRQTAKSTAHKTKNPQAAKGPDFTAIAGKFLWPVFILYALAVIFGAMHHEPWRDEAETWLIVRDNNLPGLFRIIPYEEHPPLWFLVMMPIAKLGLPYATISYLPVVIMIAAVYLLLFKTSLPLPVKLFLPFSYIFFYEYSVISRNYCLVVFFIAAIISLYPKRFDRPLLFALCVIGLFNSEGLAFGLCFALLVLFMIDAVQLKKLKGKVVFAIIIMAIGGFYLIPYMAWHPAASMYENLILNPAKQITNVITGAIVMDGNWIIATLIWLLLLIVLGARTKPLFVFLSGAACVFYIMGFKYNLGYPRQFGILLIAAIVSFGIYQEYKDDKFNAIKLNNLDLWKYGAWVFVLIVLLQAPYTFGRYMDDIEHDFSGAKGAAKFIMNNHLENNILVGQQAWAVSAIVPYLPAGTQIYYGECERFGTYYIYDSCFQKKMWRKLPEYAVDMAYTHFKDKPESLVFIFNRPLGDRAMQYMDVLYQSPETPIKKDEAFYIYRFIKH